MNERTCLVCGRTQSTPHTPTSMIVTDSVLHFCACGCKERTYRRIRKSWKCYYVSGIAPYSETRAWVEGHEG